MLRPNLDNAVCEAQAKQKQYHDEHSRPRDFLPGDNVWTRDFRDNATKWISGVVLQSVGPLSYMIQLDDGTLWKWHVNHIRQRVVKPPTSSSTSDSTETDTSPFITYPLQSRNVKRSNTEQSPPSSVTIPRRNPPRDRRPPKRFQT